jgi:hypothetical protein
LPVVYYRVKGPKGIAGLFIVATIIEVICVFMSIFMLQADIIGQQFNCQALLQTFSSMFHHLLLIPSVGSLSV